MTLTTFTPADPALELSGRVGEDVEIIGPARGQATGLAFVVRGVETGATYLAWADELSTVDASVEVLV